jgi:ADP-ribose pyrophosphatase YjhB (NUDIX family)
MTFQAEVYQVADELRAIANMGLHFSVSAYDTDRYERVLKASARLVAALELRDPDEVLQDYRGHLGHVSPLNSADAVVVRDGQILLIQRRDSGLWAVPGGMVEVGDTLAGAAMRELREETGLLGQAIQYLGYFDSRTVGSRSRQQLFHYSFLVEAEGEPGPSNETLDAAFFAPDALPELHFEHQVMVPKLLALLASGETAPLFE